MPRDSNQDLPRTLQRSDGHAQRLWAKSHEGAVQTYGRGRRAQQTAYAALKHEYEKRGDRWVRKAEKGPSDPHAAAPRGSREFDRTPTAGGKTARSTGEAKQKAREARSEYSRDRRQRIKEGRW
ncbi:MAG: ChaB family protein [Candidatus Dormibacteraeota bacterium]|nr:ChaB family protein [Candidatus Dormibacteraeota bacterium]